MHLDQYLKTPGSLKVAELRALIGVKSDAQIRQWQHGYADRMPSPAYCLAIERATGGAVSRQDLRPDDFRKIWPDLSDAPESPEEKAST